MSARSRIGIVRLCSAEPMGQELAERALVAALILANDKYSLTDLRIAGPRAPVAAERRLPVVKLSGLPWSTQRLVGRITYGRVNLVHRLDLRLPPAAAPEILTVHDIAPIRFSDEGRFPRMAMRSIMRAQAVACPSRFAAHELATQFGRTDIDVVPNGVDPAFLTASPLDSDERRLLGLPERWILHSGGASSRKNLGALAQAWPLVHARYPDITLLLSGPPDSRRDQLFRQLPGVRLMGKVSRPFLIKLMASAAVVVVPSHYEGFGLPALEAMACGVPLVATNVSSLSEVAGPGAILVDPTPEGLGEGLMQALAGVPAELLAASRELARARTWETAANGYLAIYDRVLARER
jgi:glycosyltransferase involved in cell wall biosynthesis